MSKIISIANQKGGVGKTTTALNLGVALTLNDKKVLLVDLDSQSNLSSYLKFENDTTKKTLSDLMADVVSNKINESTFDISPYIQHNDINNIDYIPSDLNLAYVETALSTAFAREAILKRCLYPLIHSNIYDIIIIDCPPTLAMLLINALTCSTDVVIPVQTQKLALEGLDRLNEIISQVKTYYNPNLNVLGILPTLTEHTTVSKDSLTDVLNKYSDLCFNVSIPRCVEAPKSVTSGLSVCLDNNAPKLKACYEQLALEILNRI